MTPGILYVVATPIGNLGDMSPRAIDILKSVALIAAEDTRHTRNLLQHFGIQTPMTSVHDHNEFQRTEQLLARIAGGESMALVSDAGTPLISDPGHHLVSYARDQGLSVVPIPGSCAAIAALSVCGMAVDRWVFEGFLPAKSIARVQRLNQLVHGEHAMVFYEAPHRIEAMLQDAMQTFGAERMAFLAREMTKTFETSRRDTLTALHQWVAHDANQRRGEFVVIVSGLSKTDNDEKRIEAERVLKLTLEFLSPARAAALTAQITGGRKNELYELALQLQH